MRSTTHALRPRRSLTTTTAFLLSALLLLALPALAPQSMAASGQDAEEPMPATGTDNVLRPGDMVRVVVWRQEELSGEFFITESGRIGHPLFRSIVAARRPVAEVEESLRLFLRDFESEPNFVVEAFFQVAVGGQVRLPDVHPLRPGTTVAEAVARAGGVTEQGALDRVILRRGTDEYRLDLTNPASRARNITIRSGDELVVERRRNVMREYVLPIISVAGSLASIIRLTRN